MLPPSRQRAEFRAALHCCEESARRRDSMKLIGTTMLALVLTLDSRSLLAQPIVAAGRPARLDIREAGAHSVRITLSPSGLGAAPPFTPALADRPYRPPALSLQSLKAAVRRRVGALNVEVRPNPLTVI